MRVNEALDEMDKLVLMSHPGNRAKIEKVLDDVWREAYEEGLARTFESPGETEESS